jgi:crotonobetainyl-CoA:carnitine CoA-transferase CaiB-like acyl-CoA transferase
MTVSSSRESALAGIRVVDASSGIAGPLAAMWLGDFGAQVIRVEPPDGGPGRHPLAGAPMWDRNKTVMRAGLGSDKVTALVRGADIVVTSSEPAAAALDLASGVRPGQLVHLSMPSFGGRDDVDGLTADAMTGAATGLARRQSSFGGGPVEAVYPHLSYIQGGWGATCAIAALLEREKSGLGQLVTVDGLHGALVAATPTFVVDLEQPLQTTAVGPSGPNPVYSPYRCADGQWLFLGALTAKFQRAAFEVLGISGILTDPRIAGDGTRLYSPDNRDWVRKRIAAAFGSAPRDVWLEMLAANDCPSGPVSRRDGWLGHPQLVALGQRREVDDPVTGATVFPWVPVSLSETPALAPRARRLREPAGWAGPGFQPPPGTGAAAAGPLAGTRVLDLGTILAGPYCGMLLAGLGADVVKVEPLDGDSFRIAGFQYNRGQRGLAVNLRDPAGHAAFLRLAATADVVVDNYRPGVLQRLKIGYAELSQTRPDIVTVSVTGFGDVGPLAGRPGFDPILQAMSGMMAAQGGDSDPVFLTMAVNDVTAACVSALGACAALYHRARGGGGQQVTTSLCAVSAYMQSGELTQFAGRPRARLGGRDYAGPAVLSRYYATADGFIRLHVENAAQLIEAGILPAGREPDGAQAAIAASLAAMSTAQAVAAVGSAGGHAVPARTQADLARDPSVAGGQYLDQLARPDGKSLVVPGRYARFSRTEANRFLPPPGLGEHTRAVLAEAGLREEEVTALVDAGAVSQGSPMTSFGGVGYR